MFVTAICEAEYACRDEFYVVFNAWFGFTELSGVLEALIPSVGREEHAEEESSQSMNFQTTQSISSSKGA